MWRFIATAQSFRGRESHDAAFRNLAVRPLWHFCSVKHPKLMHVINDEARQTGSLRHLHWPPKAVCKFSRLQKRTKILCIASGCYTCYLMLQLDRFPCKSHRAGKFKSLRPIRLRFTLASIPTVRMKVLHFSGFRNAFSSSRQNLLP